VLEFLVKRVSSGTMLNVSYMPRVKWNFLFNSQLNFGKYSYSCSDEDVKVQFAKWRYAVNLLLLSVRMDYYQGLI